MMRLEPRKGGHVLGDLSHGGHVLAEESPRAAELARTREDVTAAPPRAADVEFSTPFGYLLDGLRDDPAAHLPAGDPAAVVAGLNALGGLMVEAAVPPAGPGETAAGDSPIPPVYTYWGQFIDHDLTANTDRDSIVSDITHADLAPLDPDFVVGNLRNLRLPALNLDSVYGDGPTLPGGRRTEAADLYEGVRLKVGSVAEAGNNPANPIPGVRIPPEGDLRRDLPRVDRKALVADGRNDENLIIAQLHTAFLRFHNAVVHRLLADDKGLKHDQAKLFRKARRLTRWHHQWLVVHDYLRTVTLPGVVDKVLLRGPSHYKPQGDELFMPLEFSVAAYRFGHSMVRAVYDHNRNFGRGANVLPNSPFNLLFLFTGKSATPFAGQTDVLPFNWIIEWDRFVHKGSPFPDRFARRIDTRLAFPLSGLANEGGNPGLPPQVAALLKQLARRNLLRGYLLSLPTGQAAATAMGVVPLSPDEIRQGNSAELNQVLDDNGFVDRSPLWYYLLKEAEVRANGTSLGELGSRIVCETIVGLLRHDEGSYLAAGDGWDPSRSRVKLPNGDPIVTVADFLRFAGVLA